MGEYNLVAGAFPRQETNLFLRENVRTGSNRDNNTEIQNSKQIGTLTKEYLSHGKP